MPPPWCAAEPMPGHMPAAAAMFPGIPWCPGAVGARVSHPSWLCTPLSSCCPPARHMRWCDGGAPVSPCPRSSPPPALRCSFSRCCCCCLACRISASAVVALPCRRPSSCSRYFFCGPGECSMGWSCASCASTSTPVQSQNERRFPNETRSALQPEPATQKGAGRYTQEGAGGSTQEGAGWYTQQGAGGSTQKGAGESTQEGAGWYTQQGAEHTRRLNEAGPRAGRRASELAREPTKVQRGGKGARRCGGLLRTLYAHKTSSRPHLPPLGPAYTSYTILQSGSKTDRGNRIDLLMSKRNPERLFNSAVPLSPRLFLRPVRTTLQFSRPLLPMVDRVCSLRGGRIGSLSRGPGRFFETRVVKNTSSRVQFCKFQVRSAVSHRLSDAPVRAAGRVIPPPPVPKATWVPGLPHCRV
eukprot:724877-Prorocentrum_minimum.AAC.4